MGKALVICETEPIAGEIVRALGGHFASEPGFLEGERLVVSWCGPHPVALAGAEAYGPRVAELELDDLPLVPERFAVAPVDGSAGAATRIATLRTLVRRLDVDRIVNALAPSDDGELDLAWLLELLDAPPWPVERVLLRSLARPAIRAAFADARPRAERQPREDAARARAEADWLVGVNATRAATLMARALGGTVTLGRLLTPVLALVVRHEREAVEPSSREVLDVALELLSGSGRYRARWSGDEDAADMPAIVERVTGKTGTVRELRVEEPASPGPLDLGALQAEASALHGMTAMRTLAATRSCYEQALLTYPGGPEPIEPTGQEARPEQLGDDERRVLEIVAERAREAPPGSAAPSGRVTVISEVDGERFRSDDLDPSELPELAEGTVVRCVRVAITREPGEVAILGDVQLLDELDEHGLGTPTTRAATIERLLELGYATREGRALHPTAKGVQVADLVGDHPLAQIEQAAVWERRLRELAEGEGDRDALVRDAATFAGEIVDDLRALPPERTRFPRRDLEIVCPRCGAGSLIENRRGFGCSTWVSREEPGCGFVIWKTVAGRAIDEELVRELVARGRTRELPGFRSRTGRPFRASLVLEPANDQPVRLEFARRP
ncbi:MAG TPA: DNA topoisomerase [Gaiellales bacterium]